MLKENRISHKILCNNKKFKDIEEMFSISLGEIRRFIRDFHSEMEKGLSGQNSSLKMIPTYVERPEGTEKGNFLALDLGGTNFRVLALELKGKRKTRPPLAKKFVLGKRYVTGTGRELFDFIAGCIKTFMDEYGISTGEKHDIGFTFSFPVKHKGVASGVLARWTKGFRVKSVVGKDVVKLLNQSLARKGLHNTRVVALANDTVSTFVAKSYEDPNCDIGVIIGTGTNACYCEKLSNIPKLKRLNASSKEMLINIEWGNFNKLHLTPYDTELDSLSENPGEQLLEKMVSGMYLGELARLVVKDLVKDKILFGGRGSTAFGKPKNFKTEYVSAIENDNSKGLFNMDTLLKKIGISNAKYADRKLLKKLCRIISTRAARISAAAMASVVTKIDPGLSRKHTIAIDGSVYEKHPVFSRMMKGTLREIFSTLISGAGRKAAHIKISLTKDGSGKGAAILAAHVVNKFC